ncbi:amidohydrolase family protein [Sphingomonas colocasiae]|uniref:Amidohydrolase family protein n=1 Tax=Sphingomonas colocasiae TaxID=1848973 RepID=A0ABS7PS51_9SPHN|nr:amidohydrolase family protein [Sphingomonas colocasiae]MBY8824171.1 amidohydrolase family protein [Sphingomonas colocasiae]
MLIDRRALCLSMAAAVPLGFAGRGVARTPGDIHDVVIANGRVMDPESGRDEIANIGIRGQRIVSIGRQPLQGRQTIDAAGKVVAPGFIDLLCYPTTDIIGQRAKIADGVTTTMQMHAGPVDVDGWYKGLAGRVLTNYGTVVGHGALRDAAGIADRFQAASPEQLERMKALAAQAIGNGAVGIGYGLEYTPGASPLETIELFRVAARHGVPNHVHVRHMEVDRNIAAVNEVIAAAAISGARAEIVHLNSAGATHRMATVLGMIDGARARGIDIGASVYPYTAWSTYIGSTIFDDGFQQKLRMTYQDIELVSTGERLTKARFDALRAKAPPLSDNRQADQSLWVIGHAMPEGDVDIALRSPIVAVGSDGWIDPGGRGHPRGAGTFSRILGVHVREKKILPLMDGLRRMTLLPAQRMEQSAPAMRDRGRIRLGAYADITVFDPATIADRATYQQPNQPSAGIAAVLVNGALVYDRGRFVDGLHPGGDIRRA